VCEKFKTITTAHFIKHGETITYIDGKPLNTTDHGLSALTYLSNQTVDKPEIIVNRLATDKSFREAATDRINANFPYNDLFEPAWRDLPRIYAWFNAARAGGSCPWGLAETELNSVVRWMEQRVRTPNQEILASEYIFQMIAAGKGVERTYKAQSDAQQKAKFDASPEGKTKALRDKYISIMAVQDCFDVRKNYAVKYIDQTVFNNARAAMRTIEAQAKKEIPGLNTDKVWAEATKQYAESAVGVSLDANKKAPQNHTKNNQSMCTIMATDLIDSVPKEAPKRNF
jgi:hypothetical protein